MARYYTIADDKSVVDIALVDDLTTVSIVDASTHLSATAHALRYAQDAYDENIGIQVALSRAVSRLARKNEKYWIRQTRPRSDAF